MWEQYNHFGKWMKKLDIHTTTFGGKKEEKSG